MLLDIAVGIIVIFAMVQGYRKGFIYTFLHLAGWLLSFVLAFAWSPKIQSLLSEKTTILPWIQEHLTARANLSLGLNDNFYAGIPEILRDSITKTVKSAENAIINSLSDLIFSAACFLLTILLIKLLFWFLTGLLSKKHRGGVTGFFDGVLGMVSGFVKGVMFVFVLFLLLTPFLSLGNPELAEKFSDLLAHSYLAGSLYDNNLLLLVVRDFLS